MALKLQTLKTEMEYLDILVVYLACGSPFGVHYFFNDRPRNRKRFIKSLVVLVAWIPYSIKLLHTKVTILLTERSNKIKSIQLTRIGKEFENFIDSDKSEVSIFELRDTLERYSELTVIRSNLTETPSKPEKELFRLAGKSDFELSSICLNRRNRKRLLFHQSLAREDFLKTLRQMAKINSSEKTIGELSAEFVKIIGDEKTLSLIDEIFANTPQTSELSSVKYPEQELWIKPKPSNEKQPSILLQTTQAKTNRQKHD